MITLEQILRIVLVFAAVFLSMAAVMVLFCAAFPGTVRRVAAAGGPASRWYSFHGLAMVVSLLALALLLRPWGLPGAAALVLLAIPVLLLLLAGYAAVVLRVGRAVLRFHRDEPFSDLVSALTGHTVFFLAISFPLVGWAACTFLLMHGLGGAMSDVAAAALRHRRSARGGAPDLGLPDAGKR